MDPTYLSRLLIYACKWSHLCLWQKLWGNSTFGISDGKAETLKELHLVPEMSFSKKKERATEQVPNTPSFHLPHTIMKWSKINLLITQRILTISWKTWNLLNFWLKKLLKLYNLYDYWWWSRLPFLNITSFQQDSPCCQRVSHLKLVLWTNLLYSNGNQTSTLSNTLGMWESTPEYRDHCLWARRLQVWLPPLHWFLCCACF